MNANAGISKPISSFVREVLVIITVHKYRLKYIFEVGNWVLFGKGAKEEYKHIVSFTRPSKQFDDFWRTDEDMAARQFICHHKLFADNPEFHK